MNKTTKTILIIIGSLLVLCACATAALLGTGLWSFGKLLQFADANTTEHPEEVAQIASEIADFDVPAGFSKQYGMKFSTFSMVQYMKESEDMYIFVMQFPAGTSIDPEEMIRQAKKNAQDPNSSWQNVDTHLVEQKPVTIRGEETTLNISEGTTEQGELYRMATAKFQGKGAGSSLLMIVGPAAEWDAQMVEEFIASIQ